MNRVSPMPRGQIHPADHARLSNAMDAKADADRAMRAAVLAAAGNGASVRELAAFTNLSTNTISRWKREKESNA